MLAGKPPPLAALTYPVLATPKLDGIRCLVLNGKAVSRTFKPIPNNHIRTTIEAGFKGYRAEFDGEIMVRNRTFNDLSGDVRREDGRPDFYYAVFDLVGPTDSLNVVDPSMTSERGIPGGLHQPYATRISSLVTLSLPDFCEKILPVICNNEAELTAYELQQLHAGFEGLCIRSPGSPYKCGRSTTGEGYLLKIKRFEDSEAEVIGVEELMHNDNPATRDAFGRTERSSHKENLRPAGTMGKLAARDLTTKIEFEIGTGYTEADRAKIWANRQVIVGKIVKYKHQPHGAKDKPRCPVFLGFRDKWDM